MNYENVYFSIIEKAKLRSKSKSEYHESHHILPKCFGGTNNKDNLVLLTAREHFICHYLLVKMQEKNSNKYYKMLKAFFMMSWNSNTQSRYMNSRLYDTMKVEFSKAFSEQAKGQNNSQFGKHRSEEVKKKISEKIKAFYLNNPDSAKNRAVNRRKPKVPIWNKGIPMNDYVKNKISESLKKYNSAKY